MVHRGNPRDSWLSFSRFETYGYKKRPQLGRFYFTVKVSIFTKMNDEMTITETIVYDVDKQNATVVAGEKPRSWTTWEGRRLTVEQIDHQHLSNIYWFNVLLYNRVYLFVVEELKTRFNSVLLPYRPDTRFDDEIRSLSKKGFLNGQLIEYNGATIGEIKK